MGIIILVAVAVVILVAILIARSMVKNRSFLAKNLVIGSDSKETIDNLRAIAKSILDSGLIPETEYSKIEVTKVNGALKRIDVESDRTRVTLYKSEDGKKWTDYKTDKYYTELGATIVVTFRVLTSMFLIFIGVAVWYYVVFLL